MLRQFAVCYLVQVVRVSAGRFIEIYIREEDDWIGRGGSSLTGKETGKVLVLRTHMVAV